MTQKTYEIKTGGMGLFLLFFLLTLLMIFLTFLGEGMNILYRILFGVGSPLFLYISFCKSLPRRYSLSIDDEGLTFSKGLLKNKTAHNTENTVSISYKDIYKFETSKMKDVNGKEIDAYALTLQFHHSNLKNSIELNSFNFGGDKNLVEFTKLLRERLNKRGKK